MHEGRDSISILCWCVLQTAARVWDALLNEGPKVLFRVALAVLKTNESTLLQQDNVGLLLREVRQAVTHLHDRDKLMKASLLALSISSCGELHTHTLHCSLLLVA